MITPVTIGICVHEYKGDDKANLTMTLCPPRKNDDNRIPTPPPPMKKTATTSIFKTGCTPYGPRKNADEMRIFCKP